MSFEVKRVALRGILDSRGEITVEAEVMLAQGMVGRGSAARAISPGRREMSRATLAALGRAALAGGALDHVSRLEGTAFKGQRDLDRVLGELNSAGPLGANVTLAISLAFARACAETKRISLDRQLSTLVTTSPGLPRPLINVFSGGIHGERPDLPFQQIMIVPKEDGFDAGLAAGLELYHAIESRVAAGSAPWAYSASSGLLVRGASHTALLDLLSEEIEALGLGERAAIAIDVAAEHLRTNRGTYLLGQDEVSGSELLAELDKLVHRYEIALIEDPFDPDDEQLWQSFTAEQRGRIEIVGDDLFATDPARVDGRLATGLLLKMDQVGTLSGALGAAEAARNQGMSLCVSHRSGETEDTAMCDLAVAVGAEFIKIGGPRRGDRVAKYNQLLRLAEARAELTRNRAA